jgi:hypothetical protein
MVFMTLEGLRGESSAGIGGGGISSRGAGGGNWTSSGGVAGRGPLSAGVRGRGMSGGERVGEVSLERPGTGFRGNCLFRWASFSDLEIVAGKREERRGRQEHFLRGLFMVATAAIVDHSPCAASTEGTGTERWLEGCEARGAAGQHREEEEEIEHGRRDLLLFKAMVKDLSSSQLAGPGGDLLVPMAIWVRPRQSIRGCAVENLRGGGSGWGVAGHDALGNDVRETRTVRKPERAGEHCLGEFAEREETLQRRRRRRRRRRLRGPRRRRPRRSRLGATARPFLSGGGYTSEAT